MASPCKFCDGKEVQSDVDVPGYDVTCEVVAFLALDYEDTSEKCSDLALAELVCCPDPPNNNVPTRCVCFLETRIK